MSKQLLTIVILVLSSLFVSKVSAQHFYSGDEIIQLTIDRSKILIQFEATLSPIEIENVVGNIDRLGGPPFGPVEKV